MINYTIIVPTHERHHYLERSIKYFSSFNANIIYVDSSEKPYLSDLAKNIRYFHCPLMTFPEKALFAIKRCSTEYVAFCADDDFLIEGALNIGIDKLKENKNITSTVGRYLGFNEDFNGTFFKIKDQNEWPDVTNDCEQNIASFLSNYQQMLWALYKRSTIMTAYSILCKEKFSNENFIELVIATTCVGTGSIIFIDEVWGVREISNKDHWGRRQVALHTLIGTSALTNDIRRFIRLLEPIIGKSHAELAINSYMASTKYKNRYSFIKNYIPDIILTLVRKTKHIRFKESNDLLLIPVVKVLMRKYR